MYSFAIAHSACLGFSLYLQRIASMRSSCCVGSFTTFSFFTAVDSGFFVFCSVNSSFVLPFFSWYATRSRPYFNLSGFTVFQFSKAPPWSELLSALVSYFSSCSSIALSNASSVAHPRIQSPFPSFPASLFFSCHSDIF